jgi:mRNA-degrading endonuclease RelE of RelBE toxin-antitoxin system
MDFTYHTEPLFDKNFKRLTKKDKVLKEKVLKKIEEICEEPERGKPLRNVLKGTQRVRIDHYVIIYAIIGSEIVFLNFDHHDFAYNFVDKK